MKAGCMILTGVIVVAIMAVCLMVKFATEIQVEDKLRDETPGPTIVRFAKPMGVISLHGNSTLALSDRFPYIAAVTRNESNTWAFACFASVILMKWIVAAAHCRRQGFTHRVLLYHDFVRNFSHTHPVLFWRVHESHINGSLPKHDLALGKLNFVGSVPSTMRSATYDEVAVKDNVEAGVWKTVSTMDKKLFLTNDFAKFDFKLAPESKCFETYGIYLDETLLCVDMSQYDSDCFIHEFGPLYVKDKLVGLIIVKPKECDVKVAIATNISYYARWISKATGITRP